MLVLTGGAGFIGSNIVQALNDRGRDDIVVVDDLTDGTKFRNLADGRIADYLDKDEFLPVLETGRLGPLDAIVHQGACSNTTEWDGRYMMATNFSYSKRLLQHCLERRIPFLYASSGAVYGRAGEQREDSACEAPLNLYGYSKALFDDYVRRRLPAAESQVVGLRYFNVYGPREAHKGEMASIAHHLFEQLRASGRARLFAGCDGYDDGEQRRDFVHVADAAAVNLWFLEHPDRSGIFNVGTGEARPFNDVARAVIDYLGRGEIDYVPLPPRLAGRYQSFTQADLTRLRAAGCDVSFRDLSLGMREYLEWLTADSDGGAVASPPGETARA